MPPICKCTQVRMLKNVHSTWEKLGTKVELHDIVLCVTKISTVLHSRRYRFIVTGRIKIQPTIWTYQMTFLTLRMQMKDLHVFSNWYQTIRMHRIPLTFIFIFAVKFNICFTCFALLVRIGFIICPYAKNQRLVHSHLDVLCLIAC